MHDLIYLLSRQGKKLLRSVCFCFWKFAHTRNSKYWNTLLTFRILFLSAWRVERRDYTRVRKRCFERKCFSSLVLHPVFQNLAWLSFPGGLGGALVCAGGLLGWSYRGTELKRCWRVPGTEGLWQVLERPHRPWPVHLPLPFSPVAGAAGPASGASALHLLLVSPACDRGGCFNASVPIWDDLVLVDRGKNHFMDFLVKKNKRKTPLLPSFLNFKKSLKSYANILIRK